MAHPDGKDQVLFTLTPTGDPSSGAYFANTKVVPGADPGLDQVVVAPGTITYAADGSVTVTDAQLTNQTTGKTVTLNATATCNSAPTSPATVTFS